MPIWLITDEARLRMEQAVDSGIQITLEQQEQYLEAAFGSRDSNLPRGMKVAGSNAEILVHGALTREPDIFAMFFGGGNTTYTDIIAALAVAESDDSIERVTMRFHSPGGEVDGMFDAVAALEGFSKPLEGVIEGQCASAAYALAAQCDSLSANNAAAQIGSIGIAATIRVPENTVTLTSSKAPKKRPDVTTEKGKADVVEYLDSLHAVFVEAIAAGRNVTADKVNSKFGQGAVLLARDALQRGMIDTIAASKLRSVPSKSSNSSSSTSTSEATTMTLEELKAAHPTLCAQLVAEGEKAGVAKERDRVVAHLVMGEASGDMKTAITAAKEGTEMTQALNAQYLAAGMNRSDTQAREGDDAAAAAAAAGADGGDSASADDASEQVAALVEAQLGIERKAS